MSNFAYNNKGAIVKGAKIGAKVVKKSGVLHAIPVVGGVVGALAQAVPDGGGGLAGVAGQVNAAMKKNAGIAGAGIAGAGTMGMEGGPLDVAGAMKLAAQLGGSKGKKGGALDVAGAMKLATQLGGLKLP